MPTNWKKIYAMKKQAEEKLMKVCPELKNESGIYVLTRDDESGLQFAYIGQSVKLVDRLVSHLNGYSQRIDISLKKRGFYDELKRPFGWKLQVFFYDESELDKQEQNYIYDYASIGYQLYNRTSGSQGQGKVGINDDQTTKGYRDGLKKGYENCLKDIREYFDKYLQFNIKRENKAYKKNGYDFKEIYIKKFNEFKELLEGNEDENETN